MLRLENVKIQDNIAEADYYPEAKTEKDFIRINLDTREILELVITSGCEAMHPAHAMRTLIRMAEEGDTSTTRMTMWY